MAIVYMPIILRQFNRNKARIELPAATIPELLSALHAACPGIRARLCNEDGTVKRYINIFLNNQDVRHLNQEQLRLTDRDEVAIIPAMAGG
jgi:molybdopterin converting factor small subunit